MRIASLTLLFLFMLGSVHSQISINSSDNIPAVGDSFEYQTVSSPPNMTDLIQKNGSNKTWDMSSFSGSPVDYDIIAPSSGQKTSDYPNSDMVEYVANNDAETYYISTSSEWTQEGSYIPAAVQVIYNDPRQLLSLPMSFNDVMNDNFSGTVENIAAGQTYYRYGS
ncbi:MAG: hypothetical protein ABEH38_08035, partial [Flavobacteriales bacterium]